MPPHENKVIAHYLDGTLIKGTTLDFFPTRETFHIMDDASMLHDIRIEDLKAVFFVRLFSGDNEQEERRGFFTQHMQGKKVMVEFEDGETIFGYTLSFTTKGLGFFVFPGDPASNNIKIFIVRGATQRVKVRTLPANYTPGH